MSDGGGGGGELCGGGRFVKITTIYQIFISIMTLSGPSCGVVVLCWTTVGEGVMKKHRRLHQGLGCGDNITFTAASTQDRTAQQKG